MLPYTVTVYQGNPNAIIPGTHVAFDIMKSWYKSYNLAALCLILQERVMLCVANALIFPYAIQGFFAPHH